jgi:aspartate 4-decarboxylase
MDPSSQTPEDAGGQERQSSLQLKNRLLHWARAFSQGDAAAHKFLSAGLGNPNWVATTPREAFFLLGEFALKESKRARDQPDIGGVPHLAGCGDRLHAFLAHYDGPGAVLLRRALQYGVGRLGFHADAFVHELSDAVIGASYPLPERMLFHAEQIVRRYLAKALCDDRPPPGELDLFAVEGSSAGISYAFESLLANGVLSQGDAVAVGTPIFSPYLELARLARFSFRTVEAHQSEVVPGRHSWHYPEAEIAKLADPEVKAFIVVNPSNPGSCAMGEETVDALTELVRTRRPDLLVVTDDAYGGFIEGFRSLAAELPHNTLLVYSFSKYFGCTGWRLGLVALHEDNVVDRLIAELPEHARAELRRRYQSITADVDGLKFIDRMVADSRDVALHHTAGLSLPQQAQMALFALFSLLDEEDDYQWRVGRLIGERFAKLLEGLGQVAADDPLRVGYYAHLDLAAWGRATIGDDFVSYVAAHADPMELVVPIVRKHGTVLLSGSSFGGPPWSVRVSLANLEADDYLAIGRDLRAIARRVVTEWKIRDTH